MVLDKGNNDEVFNALPIEDYDKDYEGSGLWGPEKFNLLILETLNLKNLLLTPVLFFDWTYILLRGVRISKTGKTVVLSRFDGYRSKTFTFKALDCLLLHLVFPNGGAPVNI